MSSTFTTDDQTLKKLQSKVHESSLVLYVFFALTVAFVAIVITVVMVKCCVSLKHSKKYNLSHDHTHNSSNDYNDVEEIYEEPEGVTKGDGANTFRMKPNMIYKGKI